MTAASVWGNAVDPDRLAAVYTRRRSTPAQRAASRANGRLGGRFGHLGGLPPRYVGDVRERRAASARAARARGVDRAAAESEWAADPTGLTWSLDARHLFAADLDYLAAIAAGLTPPPNHPSNRR